MSIIVKALIPAKVAETSSTVQYTATNCRAVIDKFTVTNTSAANSIISVHLVAASGSAGVNNQILKDRSIAPNETYTCPELIGHVIETNGTIVTIAGTASSLTIRSTGREITA